MSVQMTRGNETAVVPDCFVNRMQSIGWKAPVSATSAPSTPVAETAAVESTQAAADTKEIA